MSDQLASTHLAQEISTQPDNWAAARDLAEQHVDLLPKAGERVAVIGCGTSLYMAQAYADLRESGTGTTRPQGITDAWTPTEARLGRDYDRVLAITRSGTTTEIIELLQSLPANLPKTVITATVDSPVCNLASTVLTPEVDERSVVQTRFATSTLAMLRWHLGENLDQAIADAATVLAADDSSLAPADTAEQLTFVGRGWTNGLAQEAGLKLRESAQLWTESYPMTEYRHGPRAISAPGRVVWAFGDLVENLSRDVAETGADLMHAPGLDPMADLLRVHRLCVLRAEAAGLNPDEPRNLTRSIILD